MISASSCIEPLFELEVILANSLSSLYSIMKLENYMVAIATPLLSFTQLLVLRRPASREILVYLPPHKRLLPTGSSLMQALKQFILTWTTFMG